MLVLTFLRYTPSKVARHNSKKLLFLSLCFVDFPSFWASFSVAVCPSLWHLWQQKIKIAVECVRATRTHEKRSSRSACLCPFFLLLSSWGKRGSYYFSFVLSPLYSNLECVYRRKCSFPRFFPLWDKISPYTYRDAPMMRTSSIPFYFHGESQPNI